MSFDSCLVHAPENASKFQTTLTKLRRIREFSENIYRQLPQQCCSCYGTTNCTSVNIETLRNICLSLISSPTKKKDSDEENEDSTPIRWKKNKKKQQMKFDRTSDLKQQLDEYNDRHRVHFDRTDSNDVEHNHYPQPRSSAQEKRKENCKKLVASFKSIAVPNNCCAVHDRKYISKFNNLLNLLRIVSDYPKRVYQEFPKHCCSCNAERKLNSIDPQVFRTELERIQSIPLPRTKAETVEPFHWIILPHESSLNDDVRRYKIGQFVGKKGRHLLAWQDRYNIRINIIDQSSKDKIKERISTIGSISDANGVVLSFQKRNLQMKEPLKTDEIKAKILEAWKSMKDTIPPVRPPKHFFERAECW